jgi:hypothetical protein
MSVRDIAYNIPPVRNSVLDYELIRFAIRRSSSGP